MTSAALTFFDLPKSIRRPLTISEVAAIAETDRKSVNRMIDDGVLPESFLNMTRPSKGLARCRFLEHTACPMVVFNVTNGSHVSPQIRTRVFNRIDLMMRDGTTDAVLTEGAMTLDLAKVLNETVKRMLALARAEADVERDDDRRGGVPMLRGTRIMVHELADLAQHETLDALLEVFPRLTAERVENARIYAKAHPLNGRPRTRPKLPQVIQKMSSTTVSLGPV